MRTYEDALEMTQDEVAAELGVSRAYVSRVERRAMKKLERAAAACPALAEMRMKERDA